MDVKGVVGSESLLSLLRIEMRKRRDVKGVGPNTLDIAAS